MRADCRHYKETGKDRDCCRLPKVAHAGGGGCLGGIPFWPDVSCLGGDYAAGGRIAAVAGGTGTVWEKRGGIERGLPAAWRPGRGGGRGAACAARGARSECARSAREIPADCCCTRPRLEERPGSGTPFANHAARSQVHREDHHWRSADRAEGEPG